ncbi:MAG: hypothetical protein AAGF93_12180 [Cyanobacteria bacterium P01_H01_bin.105]
MIARSRGTNRVQRTAEQVKQKAEELKQQAYRLGNNPDEIDNWIVKILVYATFIIPLQLFVSNIGPYQRAFGALLGRAGILIDLTGLIAILLIQYTEIRPFTCSIHTSRKAWVQRIYVALAGFTIDLAVCSWAWNIFDNQYGTPMISDINWLNMGRILSIVCGFSIWFAFRKFMQRRA